MCPRPKHTRKDANHARIVEAGREAGAAVFDISDLPDAVCPGDILVYWEDRWHGWMWQVFEIKTLGGALTPQQQELCLRYRIPVAHSWAEIASWYQGAWGRVEAMRDET